MTHDRALPIVAVLLSRATHTGLPVWPLPLPGSERVAVMAGESLVLEIFDNASTALHWVERQRERSTPCHA